MPDYNICPCLQPLLKEPDMQRSIAAAFVISFWLSPVLFAQAPPAGNQAADVAALRAQIEALKADYEKRIQALETQLEEIQTKMFQLTPESEVTAGQPAAAAATTQTSFGALNPAISVIGNFVARADNQDVFAPDGDRIDNRMNLREAEIDMRVPID